MGDGGIGLDISLGRAVTVAWQANIMHHEKGGSLTLTNLLPNYLRVILYGRTDKRSLSKRHSNCVLVWDC